MSWPQPILTDSGGYQVFSLADLRKVKAQKTLTALIELGNFDKAYHDLRDYEKNGLPRVALTYVSHARALAPSRPRRGRCTEVPRIMATSRALATRTSSEGTAHPEGGRADPMRRRRVDFGRLQRRPRI